MPISLAIRISSAEKRGLAVPLSQLEAAEVDDKTEEAIEDWQYWVEQGYQL